ncbi:MAG TPA: tetratricopeptide repeat protein [Drouetiella sp.]
MATIGGPLKTVILVLAVPLMFCFQAPLQATEPQDWDKVLKKGNDEYKLGNTEKAIAFFQEKCKKYPLSGACHTALGRSLKRLGKFSEGKEELRKATDLEPSYAPGWYELGVMLESDKDYRGAVAAFEKFLDLDSDAGQRKLVSDRIRSCKEHM